MKPSLSPSMTRLILFLEAFLGKRSFLVFLCEQTAEECWASVSSLRICTLDLEVQRVACNSRRKAYSLAKHKSLFGLLYLKISHGDLECRWRCCLQTNVMIPIIFSNISYMQQGINFLMDPSPGEGILVGERGVKQTHGLHKFP